MLQIGGSSLFFWLGDMHCLKLEKPSGREKKIIRNPGRTVGANDEGKVFRKSYRVRVLGYDAAGGPDRQTENRSTFRKFNEFVRKISGRKG